VRRLAGLLTREQDQLVWRFAMQAIASDATPEATRLVELALNSSWPDVRVLGCEYVRRHGQTAFAPWLLPLINESNKQVQLAAVVAAGSCGNAVVLDGLPARDNAVALPGVRPLLASSDHRLQIAVATTMARLGDPQGMVELERLAFHENPQLREDAVRVMGESGQTRFVETLIRLGWTESHPRVRRALLASLESLVPPEKRPKLGRGVGEDGMIKSWIDWQQGR
jgi:HEAT repeat protein